MLSRVASNLYWMARNIERAENNARVLESRIINALESAEEGAVAEGEWEAVMEICASMEEYLQSHNHLVAEEAAYYIACDRTNMNSVANCIHFARESAKSVREIIPEELWSILNEAYLSLGENRGGHRSMKEIYAFLQRVKTLSFTFQGAIESTMLRETPYLFIKIGKWLERAEKTARILNVVCDKTNEATGSDDAEHYYYWLGALQFVNGYDAYLKRNPPIMNPDKVLNFLISYHPFPRSIEYCVDHVREAVSQLEDGKVAHYSEDLFKALDNVSGEFAKIKFKEMSTAETAPFLDRFQNECNRISYVFSKTYYLI